MKSVGALMARNIRASAIAPNFGLALWLRADFGVFTDTGRTTPAVNNGDNVMGWADQSGTSNHASGVISSVHPVLALNSVNGKPTITMDGSSYFSLANTNTMPKNTMFVVHKNTDAVNGSILLSQIGTVQDHLFDNTTNVVLWPDDTPQVVGIGITDNKFNVFGGICDGTNINTFCNGVLGTPAANANGFVLNSVGSYVSSDFYIQGSLAEVMVYNRLLSTSEFNRVNKYLMNKYAIS